MAFRLVYTDFWEDPKVMEEMTPEDRYFYLYLLTNPHTNMIGIYQILKKQMAFELGYSPESINSLLDRFINHHKLIKYDTETKEIFIKKYAKYNLNKGGRPIECCIEKELKSIKNTQWLIEIVDLIPNTKIRNIILEFYNNQLSNDTFNDSSDDTYNDTNYDSFTIRGETKPNQNQNQNQNQKMVGVVVDNELGSVFDYFEKHNFMLSPAQYDLIKADYEQFSKEEILKAIEISDNNCKRTYNYFKGVLNKIHTEGIKNEKPKVKISFGLDNSEFGWR